MKKWKMATGLIILFLCGVVVGAVGAGSIIRTLAETFGDKGRPHPIKMLMLKNIEHRLDPDDLTMERLRADIEISMGEMKEVRREIAPRFKMVMNGFVDRASEYLTPKQQKKLLELMDDFKNSRHDKLKGPGWFMPMPPPPPPWEGPPKK